jgi:hypothetical protein
VEELEERKTIGERLLERMELRERPAPRLTASNHAFDSRFSRFARTKLESRLGALMFPDTVQHGPETAGRGSIEGDWSYLSSSPYWNRLRRLGNARLRRQQRLAGLQQRMCQRTRLTAMRRLPEVRSVGLPFLGLSSLMATDFEILAHAANEVPQDVSTLGTLEESRPGSVFQGARTSSSPWLSGVFSPAPVATKPEKSRPLDRIVERAPAPKGAIERVRSAVQTRSASFDMAAKATGLSHKSQGSSERVSIIAPQNVDTEIMSEERREIRRARTALRRRSNPVRAVEMDYEAALPDDFLPPSRHAEGRLVSRSARVQPRRGLRPVMSQSPLMASLEPAGSRGESSIQVSGPPTHRPVAVAGETIARRTVHRQVEPSKQLLSASPVRRPAMVAPSAVTLVGTQPEMETTEPQAVTSGARKSKSISTEVESASSVVRGTRRSRPAPMVRALQRSEAQGLPVFERPLTERRPVANRPIQTRDGLFAPERSVLTPGVDAQSLTEDAVPVEAQRRATRNNVAVRASQRRSAGLPAEPENQPENAPAAIRRNRAVQTAAQVFASASSLQSDTQIGIAQSPVADRPIERASERLVTRPVPTDDVGFRPVERAADRLDPSSEPDIRIRRAHVPSSAIEPITVEHALEGAASEDLAQGAHAAERAKRGPLVGYTAAKVARTPKSEHRHAETHKTQPSRWAPRRFKSPVRHAQLRPRTMRTSPGSGSITLAPVEVRQDGPQRPPSLDIRQVQEAWERTERPIDWTAARIEVIQVPILAESAPVEAKTVRTETGAFVSAQARRGATRGPASVADTGVVPVPGFAQSTGADGEQELDFDASVSAGATPAPRRTGFEHTVTGVEQGVVHNEMPVWAQRSTGRPLIRDAKDLVSELAKASAPEQIVQLLMSDGDGIRRATSSLPQPVIQVIQQIKSEAARSDNEVQEQIIKETEMQRRRGSQRGGVRSTARVVRGMTGLKPRGSGGGASTSLNKVSKLAKRLQDLIAMAENQNRGGARQEVRMAEDSGAAKAEGASAPTQAEDGRNVSADIDNLAREVTEHVTRELELRRERRQEDPDGRNIWW